MQFRARYARLDFKIRRKRNRDTQLQTSDCGENISDAKFHREAKLPDDDDDVKDDDDTLDETTRWSITYGISARCCETPGSKTRV